MPRKRDQLKAETKVLLSLRQASANRKQADSRLAIARAVERSRNLLNDRSFLKILRSENVETIPAFRGTRRRTQQCDPALEFMVAWAFFYPLFSKRAVKNYLQDEWPGFIAEIKDAFIDFVVKGPFRRPHKNDWVAV